MEHAVATFYYNNNVYLLHYVQFLHYVQLLHYELLHMPMQIHDCWPIFSATLPYY